MWCKRLPIESGSFEVLMRSSNEPANDERKLDMKSNNMSNPLEEVDTNVSVDSKSMATNPSTSISLFIKFKDVKTPYTSYISFSFRRFLLGALCLEELLGITFCEAELKVAF